MIWAALAYGAVGVGLAWLAAPFLVMAGEAPGRGPWPLLVGVPVVIVAWPAIVLAWLGYLAWWSWSRRR
jgi:hypothetical protein